MKYPRIKTFQVKLTIHYRSELTRHWCSSGLLESYFQITKCHGPGTLSLSEVYPVQNQGNT